MRWVGLLAALWLAGCVTTDSVERHALRPGEEALPFNFHVARFSDRPFIERDSGGVYWLHLSIDNDSGMPWYFLGVSAEDFDQARVLELRDGRERAVGALALPPGGRIELGGPRFRVRLTGYRGTYREGWLVRLYLLFRRPGARGGEVCRHKGCVIFKPVVAALGRSRP